MAERTSKKERKPDRSNRRRTHLRLLARSHDDRRQVDLSFPHLVGRSKIRPFPKDILGRSVRRAIAQEQATCRVRRPQKGGFLPNHGQSEVDPRSQLQPGLILPNAVVLTGVVGKHSATTVDLFRSPQRLHFLWQTLGLELV